jgi:hypothetical protein
MFINRRKMVMAVLASAAVVFVLITQIGASRAGHGVVAMEGAWIAKVLGSPAQWTYTLSPDPSGRRAAITGFIQVGIKTSIFGYFNDFEFNSPIVGEAVMTPDGTVVFNSVWYGIKAGFPFDQIVYIGMNSGQVRFTGPGKGEGTHNLAFYDPSSDQDGDGLPDPGATPVLEIPATTVETRLSL